VREDYTGTKTSMPDQWQRMAVSNCDTLSLNIVLNMGGCS
jgi:hypothetical protein